MAYLKFSNQGGFPNIEAVSVTSDGTNTTVSFNSHPFRETNRFFGGFWVKIPQTVISSSEPLYFATVGEPGSSIPVYLASGNQANVGAIVSSGPAIYLCFYDRDNLRVQMIG